MTKKKNLIISLVAVLAVFVMLFFIGFVVIAADHDCKGEDCPICYEISVCEHAIKSTWYAGTTAIMILLFTLFIVSIDVYSQNTNNISLVTLKVKLSN